MATLAAACGSDSFECEHIVLVEFTSPIVPTGTVLAVASGSREEAECTAARVPGSGVCRTSCPGEGVLFMVGPTQSCALTGLRLGKAILGDPISVRIEHDGDIIGEDDITPTLDRISSSGCEIWVSAMTVAAPSQGGP